MFFLSVQKQHPNEIQARIFIVNRRIKSQVVFDFFFSYFIENISSSIISLATIYFFRFTFMRVFFILLPRHGIRAIFVDW